jgi:hypothetical protein
MSLALCSAESGESEQLHHGKFRFSYKENHIIIIIDGTHTIE